MPKASLHSSSVLLPLKVLSECNDILGPLVVPCEGGGRAVKEGTVPVKSKQASRSHKKGRTDYRLKEGKPVNLRVGIKQRVIFDSGRSNANLLILAGLSVRPDWNRAGACRSFFCAHQQKTRSQLLVPACAPLCHLRDDLGSWSDVCAGTRACSCL